MELIQKYSCRQPIFSKKTDAEHRVGLFELFISFFFEISDHPLTGYDTNECTAVVGYGQEVMRKQALGKLLDPRRDLHGRIAVGLQNIRDMQLLAFLHARAADIDNMPEEVALCERSDVLSRLIHDGNGGIAVIAHLLEALTEGVVVLDKRRLTLRDQKESYVHSAPPALFGKERRYGIGKLLRVLERKKLILSSVEAYHAIALAEAGDLDLVCGLASLIEGNKNAEYLGLLNVCGFVLEIRDIGFRLEILKCLDECPECFRIIGFLGGIGGLSVGSLDGDLDRIAARGEGHRINALVIREPDLVGHQLCRFLGKESYPLVRGGKRIDELGICSIGVDIALLGLRADLNDVFLFGQNAVLALVSLIADNKPSALGKAVLFVRGVKTDAFVEGKLRDKIGKLVRESAVKRLL